MTLGSLALLLCGSVWASKVEPMPLEQRKAVMNLSGPVTEVCRWALADSEMRGTP